MGKEKISPAVKQKTVIEIESSRLSQGEAVKRIGVDESTIRQWQSYCVQHIYFIVLLTERFTLMVSGAFLLKSSHR